MHGEKHLVDNSNCCAHRRRAIRRDTMPQTSFSRATFVTKLKKKITPQKSFKKREKCSRNTHARAQTQMLTGGAKHPRVAFPSRETHSTWRDRKLQATTYALVQCRGEGETS